MISQLKQKLLEIKLVIDNTYLDKYCELVVINKPNKTQIHRTQCHHIIPRYYYKGVEDSLEKDKDNKVNLLYKDHILAHYYLARCSYTDEYAAKNVLALSKMSNCPQTYIVDCDIREFISRLDNIQELYECMAKHQGDKLRGKKQSAEHIQARVNKNTGQKRSLETRKKMSEWQKGKPKSKEACNNMSKAQLNYFSTVDEEKRKARAAKANATKAAWSQERKEEYSQKLSKALKGRKVPESERLHKSISMKGVPKSEEHRIKLSRARSRYNYFVDGFMFESSMEVITYLQEKTGFEFSKHKWCDIINVQGNLDEIIIEKNLKEKYLNK